MNIREIKRLKNVTESIVIHQKSGVAFPINEYLDVEKDRLDLYLDDQMHEYVSGGTLVFNDGRRDVPTVCAWDRLRIYDQEVDNRRYTKEPTGYYNRDAIDMEFYDEDRTLRINMENGLCNYLICGTTYDIVSGTEYQIPDSEGYHFIYYNADVLESKQTPWSFEDEVAFTAIIYWDADNKKCIRRLEERHGFTQWETHRRWHRTTGTVKEDFGLEVINYIEGGDGSLDSHAQIGVSDGIIHDEDIMMPIRHSDNPTEKFEQILRPVLYSKGLYILDEDKMRQSVSGAFPIITDYPNTPLYNAYDAVSGTHSLVNVPDGYYFVSWLFVTNDWRDPVVHIPGTYVGSDLIDVVEGNVISEVKDRFAEFPEYVALSKLIYQADSNYANNAKARLMAASTAIATPPTNDRYQIPFQYTGNAGTNKYLDVFAGISSSEAPFIFPEDSYVRTVTLHTLSLNTGTIGFFLVTDLVNPVFTISFLNEYENTFIFSQRFNKGDGLMVRVTDGSFSKPAGRMYIQTDLI